MVRLTGFSPAFSPITIFKVGTTYVHIEQIGSKAGIGSLTDGSVVNGKQQKKVLNASSPLGIDFGPRNELTQ
jgi:hypothetical protein